MSYSIRRATRNDISPLGSLLNAYMQETYGGAWGGNTQRLEQDLLGNTVDILVAEAPEGEIIAFIAWVACYDLHWCMKGGDVIDLFVCSAHRSRGVAVMLIARAATEIQGRGGTFLKGGAVENPVVHRLYQRIARNTSGHDYYVSGRAFRRLAELSGKRIREILTNLPEAAWNQEP